MKKLRTTGWFLLLVIFLMALVSLALAQEAPTAAEDQALQHEPLAGVSLAQSSAEVQSELSTTDRHSMALTIDSLNLAPEGEKMTQEVNSTVLEGAAVDIPQLAETAEPELEAASHKDPLDFSGRYVGLVSDSFEPDAVSDVCNQLLKNTMVTVSGGSVAPWVILDTIIYFSDTVYTSAPHSLFMEDQDSGDPSPDVDAFAQVVKVAAGNLKKVTIRYNTISVNSNEDDYTGGAIWTVDAGGDLKDYVTDWHVRDSEGEWKGRIFEITDNATLNKMEGKNIALIFFNDTDNSGKKERAFFDDITLTTCHEDPPNSFITVQKKTTPAGATQKFTFDPSWSGSNFQLTHDEKLKSPALAPGTYSVKEIVPSGWKLDKVTCSDGSSPNSISLQKGETVTCTFTNKKLEPVQTCGQVLVNTKLDVVKFGDGFGKAEPWVIVRPIVWFTSNPSVAYDGDSLLLKDGDSSNDGTPDPSPTQDMFAQGFQMPGNLTEVKIEFRRATVDTNGTDEAYVELWKLDKDWILHLDQPDKYFVAGSEVVDSAGAWGKQTVNANAAALINAMSGQKMAILLFNVTDGGGSKKEWVYFDNIMLTACSKSTPSAGKVYMPVINNKFGKASGPICSPPIDNPLDRYNSDRGLVQTGAMCNSNLSPADIADYYTFKPAKNGNHTLRLTNLPKGTEWSAMIFTDTGSPAYAPGGASDGKCRITQPGSGNKQVVCNLNMSQDYFVKVSAGSTPVNGSYGMRITAP